MYCKSCGNTNLEIGIAIDPKRDENALVFQIAIISWETLKFIDVYKCPKCGWSEEIENE